MFFNSATYEKLPGRGSFVLPRRRNEIQIMKLKLFAYPSCLDYATGNGVSQPDLAFAVVTTNRAPCGVS